MTTRPSASPATPGSLGSLRSLGILLAALAISLLGVGAARAEPDRGGGSPDRDAKQADTRQDEKREGDGDARHRRGGRLTGALFKDIELTDQQLEQVREMGRAHMTRVRGWHKEHRDQLQTLHRQMRDARRDGDEAAADAAGDKLKALSETRPRFGDLFKQMRGVLSTDTERETFDANRARLREAIKEHRDKRRARRDKDRRGQGKDAREGDGKIDDSNAADEATD